MKKTIVLLLTLLFTALALCACAGEQPAAAALPPPEADGNSMFAVDANINMATIDNYLGRDDVAYRDVRMLFDPADYGAIGGDADLSRTITGFKVVPFPYVATLQPLPVEGAYTGETLFDVVWTADGLVESATANYAESQQIMDELFPRDQAIFLICGGGGYANMMKLLLIHLGWDENLLYNVGANWEYTGGNSLELIVQPEQADGDKIYATWRADYAYIDFNRLHPAEN